MAIQAFHEVRLPTDISQGASGGPGWNTTVITTSDSSERRNQNWANQRCSYDISKALQTQAQLNALLKFFYARRGRAYGFRFKDWSDYQLPFWTTTPGDLDPLPTLFTTDGTTATFQLTKLYADTVNPFSRKIVKPVAGTLALFNNGVSTSDWTVDTTTGIVTLGNTTKSTTGHVITGHCEFDVPVRFDTDEMKASLKDYDITAWEQIPLVELKF